jgi:soluble lytic murein transglycosylase-like protein
MHPTTFLLAALIFAVPSRAVMAAETPAAPAAALRALAPPAPPRATAVPVPAGPYRGTVQRLLKKPSRDRYDALIRREAAARGLDPRLVKSVIAAESELTVRARSRAGALGLMQLMPETAASVGVPRRRLFDPPANIRAGTRYLAWLFHRAWRRYGLGRLPFARGPRWVAERPLCRQTRRHVAKVLAFYRSRLSVLRA